MRSTAYPRAGSSVPPHRARPPSWTQNIYERYGIVVELKLDGQAAPTDETTRVIVSHAIRALVINAAKHAGVQVVRVHLECRGRRLHAVVTDDGMGVDPGTAFNEGFGLLSIRERMAHIGGQMTIDSMRGKGTTVRLSAALRAGEPMGSRTELG
jgi:signal transduction histidine kinase